jgi:hypothetical protein
MSDAVQLDQPGAGLPAYETFFLRYVSFPRYVRTMTWHSAVELFHEEGQKINALVHPLSDLQLLSPILIDRLRGMEDSSRNWSPAMTMKHLIITGKDFKDVIIHLNEGKIPERNVNIANYKPSPEIGWEVIGRFKGFQDEFITIMSDERYHRSSDIKLDHPWLGPLNSFQWLCLAAGHQYLHRTQIKKILSNYN